MFSSATYNQLQQTSTFTPTGKSQLSLGCTGLGQALRVTNRPIGQVNDQLGLNEDTGSPNTFYTRDAKGTILAERRSGSNYYFLHDGLGSTLADGSGNVALTNKYEG